MTDNSTWRTDNHDARVGEIALQMLENAQNNIPYDVEAAIAEFPEDLQEDVQERLLTAALLPLLAVG